MAKERVLPGLGPELRHVWPSALCADHNSQNQAILGSLGPTLCAYSSYASNCIISCPKLADTQNNPPWDYLTPGRREKGKCLYLKVKWLNFLCHLVKSLQKEVNSQRSNKPS